MRKIILCAAGLAVSLYLSLTAYSCFGSGCSAVHLSPYARIAGMPVAWIGVAGYLALLAAYWRGFVLTDLMVIAGTVMEAYFVAVQAFLIREYCVWCMVSAVIMFSLFALEFKWKAALSAALFLLAMGIYTASGLAGEPANQFRPDAPPVQKAVKRTAETPPAEITFYDGGITLYDRAGNSLSVPGDKPLLVFHPACSHCVGPIEKAASLPAEKRPVLVCAAVWDDSVWDMAEAKAVECGFPDPVYAGVELQRDQSLPVLMIGDQMISGDNKIIEALSR